MRCSHEPSTWIQVGASWSSLVLRLLLMSVKSAVTIALVLWVVVLLCVAQNFFVHHGQNDLEQANGIAIRLDEALSSIKELKKQNIELQQMIRDQKREDVREAKSDKWSRIRANREEKSEAKNVAAKPNIETAAVPGPSKEFEVRRRAVDQRVWELFYYLHHEFKSNATSGRVKNHTTDQLISLLAYSANLTETQADWRRSSLQKLTDKIQKTIDRLQNPDDCGKARVLVCNLDKQCGFGCQLHHVGYCFAVAFGESRTLVLQADGSHWRYSKKGWAGAFKPVSRCTHAAALAGGSAAFYRQKSEARVVELPIVDALQDRPKTLPLVIPRQLADEMLTLHSNPPLYFISQFLWYLMRSNADTQTIVEKAAANVPFGESPIVGIQVRRTDKIGTEAAFHAVEEYMEWTEIWFKVQDARFGRRVKRRVFVASDDSTVLPETRKKYPEYEVFGDVDIADTARLMSRYTDASLYGVVTDIELLSRCDYLVCTFSSQVCRMGYELKQIRGPDGEAFHSLDDLYYYGGQHDHEQVAVEEHQPASRKEIELRVGDVVGVAGNHWDGYSKGTNRRTQSQGLYPSYKVVERWRIVDFPALN